MKLTLLHIATLVAYTGNALTVVAFFMRVPIRLRQVMLFANVCFVLAAPELHLWGIFISNAILLPLNAVRLRELLATRRAVRAAMQVTDLSWDWLKPFMTRRHFASGTTIFRKGDHADELFFILAGRVELPEIGVPLETGTLFGEIAFFSPDRLRTYTAVAEEDVTLLSLGGEALISLYERNPEFGLYLVRLITRRLIDDVARAAAPTPRPLPGPAAAERFAEAVDATGYAQVEPGPGAGR